MEESDKLLDFLKEPNIFDLELIDNGRIAGTRIETFYEMNPILDELLKLKSRVDRQYYQVTQEDISSLCRKHPFLEHLRRARGMGDPYSEAVRRLELWKLARDKLRLPPSNKEREAMRAFAKFHILCMRRGGFRFLRAGPKAERKERCYLTHYAIDQLWDMAQRLKLRPLTHAQEADRQKLESYVASSVRRTLVDLEYENVSRRKYSLGQSETWRLRFEAEDRRRATKTVDERIANGDWQGPGPYKFRFNGI